MHNIWVRLNAVIFFALTVLLALATLAAFRYAHHHHLIPSLDHALFEFTITIHRIPAHTCTTDSRS